MCTQRYYPIVTYCAVLMIAVTLMGCPSGINVVPGDPDLTGKWKATVTVDTEEKVQTFTFSGTKITAAFDISDLASGIGISVPVYLEAKGTFTVDALSGTLTATYTSIEIAAYSVVRITFPVSDFWADLSDPLEPFTVTYAYQVAGSALDLDYPEGTDLTFLNTPITNQTQLARVLVAHPYIHSVGATGDSVYTLQP